jgi:zinc D-Ala-D-Ala carboxypeptidase
MRLSRNFTLAELTRSQTAIRRGIDNSPTMTVIDNLQALVDNVLQPLRDAQGPVNITSGFRSEAINAAVGGSNTSHHTRGMAADLTVVGKTNKEICEWIRDNLKFTQLIWEFPTKENPQAGWVHVAYDPKDLKCQVLTATKVNGRTVYKAGLVL